MALKRDFQSLRGASDSERRSNLKTVIASGKKRPRNDCGRIGVLMGGPSREREISLRSGAAVLAALREVGVDASAIDITCDDPQINIDLIQAGNIDCAFLALHGRFGEDGAIQEILEAMKVPYTGSGVRASRLAMDKSASLGLFRERGLRVPDHEILEKCCPKEGAELAARFGLPLVVKPSSEGSSIGLSIIHQLKEFGSAMDLAFGLGDKVIVGNFVRGREVTVGILDEKPLPAVEIIPKKGCFDYESKYNKGMTDYHVPAKLDKATANGLGAAALWAHKALGCSGCSRVDMILGPDNLPYILEVNTIPGMTATSLLPKAALAAGIDFPGLCLKLIDLAYDPSKSSGSSCASTGSA